MNQIHENSCVHEMPNNLLGSTLAWLSRASWEISHFNTLRKLKLRELRALGQLIENPDSLLTALRNFKGPQYWEPPHKRVLELPKKLPEELYPSEPIRLNPFLCHPSFISAENAEIVSLWSKDADGRIVLSMNEADAVLLGERESMDIRALRALWDDCLEHECHKGSVLEFFMSTAEQPVKRIFCDHPMVRTSTSDPEHVWFPCLVVDNSIKPVHGESQLEEGDYLLVQKR